MARMRTILLAGACSMALSGCIPAAAGLALSAASLVTGGGGKDGKGFQNPIDRQTTGRQIRQALSQLDDQVDPACQAMLDEYRQTHGTLAAGKSAPSTDPAAEATPAEATDPVTDDTAADNSGADAKDRPDVDKAPRAEPPVDLLAKLEPTIEPAGGAKPTGATQSDVVEAAGGAEAETPVAGSPDAAEAPAAGEVQPVKASLGAEETTAPGQCEHRFVCLPGTPKPTLMLMCPGKGDGGPKDGKTMAGAAPDADQAGGEAGPAVSERATAALDGDAAGSDSGTATAPEEGAAAAAPSADTAVSSDTKATATAEQAPNTIVSGGVADWNWSFDPSRQR